MSFKNVMTFRRTGTMPYDGSDPTLAAQSKAAFSSNPHPDLDDDEERDAEFRTGRMAEGGQPGSSYRTDEDEYALLQQSEIDDMGAGGSRPPPSYDPVVGSGRLPGSSPAPAPAPGGLMHDYDTSYGGPYGHPQGPNDYPPAPNPYPQGPNDYGSDMYGR